MAASSSRAHLVSQLSKKARSPSPRDEEEYATAASGESLDFAGAIHSTANLGDYTTQQQLPHQPQYPLEYDQFPDQVSEGGSDGSADMSIGLGRGVKRGARERDDDVSSNHVFNLGNDSLYELTGTPPLRPAHGRKQSNDALRRQASIRRATETAKSNEAVKHIEGKKHRSLSEALHKINMEDETSFVSEEAHQTATLNIRNTRFARSRRISTNETADPSRYTSAPAQQIYRKTANATVSNSFILPDLTNIAELVSGVRKDGTPNLNRSAKSRSRFTSGSYKPATRPEHYPVENIPLPEEERAIYASLQLLRDRVDQLEVDKSEAAKRAEEYENRIIDLRSQLAVSQRRPDSGLGSSDEDGSGSERWKVEKKKMQASVKALQAHLDRSERKTSISEIAVKRITKEREELVKQIGVAYYNNEELKAAHETCEGQHGNLSSENEELKEEVNVLRRENQDLRVLMAQTQRSYDEETMQRERKETQLRTKLEKRAQTAREIKEATREILERSPKKQKNVRAAKSDSRIETEDVARRPLSLGVLDDVTSDDIAVRIAQEVRKNREEAAAKSKGQASDVAERSSRQHQAVASSRSRSKSRQRQHADDAEHNATAPKRTVSAPIEVEASDAESTTQLDFTQKSRNASKRVLLPTPARPASAAAASREEDSRDLTLLSFQDPGELAKLRKRLEEERRSGRLGGRAASAPDGTQQQTAQGVPRKSSMKDVAAASDVDTGRLNLDELTKTTKNVRMQSPHTTSDDSNYPEQQTEVGDMSFSSNTSRRRRRAASAEGMTSAFLLPDITLHSIHGKSEIQHNVQECTACSSSNKDVTIPLPIPVTDRPEDVADITNATVRPSQPPPVALATVIKQLKDEIIHLKMQLAAQTRLYFQHDPALSKRRRMDVSARMNKLQSEIDKRSDQVYALYDVLEGQKAAAAGQEEGEVEQEIEETLTGLGIDPVELSGRIGRTAAPALELDGADEMSEEELPWGGLSDVGSEEEVELFGRRSGF